MSESTIITTHQRIPRVRHTNLYQADPTGPDFFRHWMGEERFARHEKEFDLMGRMGAEAEPLSARADAESPRLETHDAAGERIDRVVYHPDYHRLEEMSYGNGIVAMKFEEQLLKKDREVRHMAGFGSAYYFAQSELGLYCPICMTDGAARLIEMHGRDEAAFHEALERLTTRDLGRLWQGGMFLTEAQGGSDVGTNEVTAEDAGDGTWKLTGDKWFCSNVDAGAVFALARMPGGPAGTRGLGLFLVLRDRPEGNHRSIRVHRIKDKFGVRSMPTGEVTLEGTRGYLMGGVNEGFKMMADMVNLSRLYNSVASVAGARRAVLEALAYGSERRAFGRTLWDLPLWRVGMADLTAEHMGMFQLVFETVRALDAADCGDREAARLVRMLTPMSKGLAGKFSVWACSEAMEAIGGNAYINESPLPRLLRDCQVLPIWEGTTNVQSLDILRSGAKETAHEAFFKRLHRALDAASGLKGETSAAQLETLHTEAETLRLDFGRILGGPDGPEQRLARHWMEQAGRLMSRALLLETAAASSALHERALAAASRLTARPVSTMGLGCGRPDSARETEQVLLESGFHRSA